jgi:outer membrane protein assembly factor BamE (lipoprotein component of BamABCDE complex)
MHSRMSLGLVLGIGLLLQGCIVTRANFGEPIQPENIAQIQKGSTTMDQVVELVGAPDRIVRGNDREIFHYYYYDAKSPGLLLLLLNLVRLDVKSDNLYVFFNKNGVAEEVVYGKRTDRTEFKLWPFGD